MIASLKGILIHKSANEVVIECNGVGYLVFISVITSEKLPDIGNEVRLFTLLQPREDAMNLYGFTSETERAAFKLLNSVSGIGAKIALGILSSVTISDLFNLITNNNIIAFKKLPGIGTKTAERIILELKDKVYQLDIKDTQDTSYTKNVIVNESVSALINIGYSKVIAEKAVKLVFADEAAKELPIEKVIKEALRLIYNGSV